MSTHTFDYSQNTFGGTLACTAVATLTACGFADNEVSFDKFRTYCCVGSKMWNDISTSPISVERILCTYAFFRSNYDIESYRSCVDNTTVDTGSSIPLAQMLDAVHGELVGRGSYGMVFTDGSASLSSELKDY